MGLEEVCLAPEFGIGGVLRLAERVPGIVTAPSRRELDGLTLGDKPFAFGPIPTALYDVLPMDDDRGMTRQADGGGLRTSHIHLKEQRMHCRHTHRLLFSVLPRPRKVKRASSKALVIQTKSGSVIRRILLVDRRNVVERHLERDGAKS